MSHEGDDNTKTPVSRSIRKGYTKITPELRQAMLDEIERTRKGASAIMRGVRPSDAGGLSASIVKSWLSGVTKTADRKKLAFVMDRWRSFPDFDDRWLAFDDSHRDRINDELTRSGAALTTVFRRDDVPDDLSLAMLRMALYGANPNFRRQHYEFVISALAELPDRSVHDPRQERRFIAAGRVELTQEMCRALFIERERTGTGESALIRAMTAAGQHGLPSSNTVHKWVSGFVRSVPPEDYQRILAFWKSLPDKPATQSKFVSRGKRTKPRIVLTDEMRTALKAQRERTGVMERVLVDMMDGEQISARASHSMINHWINGYAKTAPVEAYEAVLTAWRTLPDAR